MLAMLLAAAVAGSEPPPVTPTNEAPPTGAAGAEHHVRVTALAGIGDHFDHPVNQFAAIGGEVGWILRWFDAAVSFHRYSLGARARGGFAPVILARWEPRLEVLPWLDAVYSVGLGAARKYDWVAWGEMAFGLRVHRDRVFALLEYGIEQENIVTPGGLQLTRLSAGVGFSL